MDGDSQKYGQSWVLEIRIQRCASSNSKSAMCHNLWTHLASSSQDFKYLIAGILWSCPCPKRHSVSASQRLSPNLVAAQLGRQRDEPKARLNLVALQRGTWGFPDLSRICSRRLQVPWPMNWSMGALRASFVGPWLREDHQAGVEVFRRLMTHPDKGCWSEKHCSSGAIMMNGKSHSRLHNYTFWKP